MKPLPFLSPQRFFQINSGFSIIEILIVIVVSAILLTFSGTYLFGTFEKQKLEKERGTFVDTLKTAQQQSAHVIGGQSYGIVFDMVGPEVTGYRLEPGGKSFSLPRDITMVSSDFSDIYFKKLTGEMSVSTNRSFVFRSRKFQTQVSVNTLGNISETAVKPL